MKAAKQRLAAFARSMSREIRSSRRGANAWHARDVIYFDFFFAFFFFVAMAVILDVCCEPTARLVQSQALNLGP
jgi:hypothetical protein